MLAFGIAPVPTGAVILSRDRDPDPGGSPKIPRSIPPEALPMAESYIVRCGQMRQLGEYSGLAGQEHPRGQRVIVRSDRGTELGEVLCPATERSAAFLENPARGEILRPGAPPPPLGRGRPAWSRARSRGSPPAWSSSPSGGSRWIWSTLRRSSAVSGWSSTTSRRSGSISANSSRTWPARSRPASRCGRSASETRPSSWPITATAASPSAATPTCRACRRFRCAWPRCRKRR